MYLIVTWEEFKFSKLINKFGKRNLGNTETGLTSFLCLAEDQVI